MENSLAIKEKNEEKEKPFRRAYAMTDGYDYSGLMPYCDDIVYLVRDKKEVSLDAVVRSMGNKLDGFDPTQDVIVPAHAVPWNAVLGFLLRDHAWFVLAYYSRQENKFGISSDYSFYRITPEGVYDAFTR